MKRKNVILLSFCFVAVLLSGLFIGSGVLGVQNQSVFIKYNNTTYTQNNDNAFFEREIASRTGVVTFNVVLLDFTNANTINGIEQKTLQSYKNTFSEVTNYFLKESNNKLTLTWNFYNYTASITSEAFSCADINDIYLLKFYNEGVKKGKLLSRGGAVASGNIIIYASVERANKNTMGWPHVHHKSLSANMSEDTLVAPDYVSSATLCHEILHIFKLPDLYSNYSVQVGAIHDIMSRESLLTPVNAHLKTLLGWAGESYYFDGNPTGVEKILQSGRYTVYFENKNNNIIAYKFGERNGESFYIEARNDTIGSVLIVNRVNENVNKTNINATSNDECYIATIGEISKGKTIDFYGDKVLRKTLCYSDGTKLEIAIGNLEITQDFINFDFVTTKTLSVQKDIIVLDMITIKPVINADIKINGKYVWTTLSGLSFKVSLCAGDKITITKNHLTTNYTITKSDLEKTQIILYIKDFC